MNTRKVDMVKTDILIVGSGCSGLYCAMHLPKSKSILIITKSSVKSSDSYLAQGGICMLKNDKDYSSFFQDTLKAGHYENDQANVALMIRSSVDAINDLIDYGVEFNREDDGTLAFTREGGHSDSRILYHQDITGAEITGKLLEKVEKMPNVKILENNTMLDIVCKDHTCYGAVVKDKNGKVFVIQANDTVLATGGIGGIYPHSTNYRHLTGDSIAIALKHGIELRDVNYVQIHPTTLYSENRDDKCFLISESVRGEGAKLYDKNMNRFVDELLPRDLLTREIVKQIEKDNTEFVWEDLRTIPKGELLSHFPNIVEHCRKMGYDVTRECIPVVPAQHYFMGGIKVDHDGKTSMEQLYAVGETACTGVHGKNRLASNSLLESLVFAKRVAIKMAEQFSRTRLDESAYKVLNLNKYVDFEKISEDYRNLVWNEIAKMDEARCAKDLR